MKTFNRSYSSLSSPALLLLAATPSAQAELEAHKEGVRALYAAAAWELGPHSDGFALGALELPGLVGSDVRLRGARIERAFRLIDAPDATRPALLLQVRVEDTAAAAHEHLVGWLASLTSPLRAPEDVLYGFELGQAGYVGASAAGPRAVAWTAFVQGNVAVRMLNVDPRENPGLELPALASIVDRTITAQAPLAAGVKVSRPVIKRLYAGSASATLGQPVTLDVAVSDVQAKGEPVLAWSVAGDGQGYVERREEGWTLFPTGPGRLTVTLTTVGSTATIARSELRIDIVEE